VIILGSDRDAGAIQSARANSKRAGVAESIDFSCRAFSAIEPPSQKGWLVTNPPYGVRLSGQQDLRNLYDQLGNVLRKTCPGWRAAILCNDEKMVSRTRLNFGEGLSFSNGGIGVKCALGTVPE
jgi:23S rRNA G2445 N2-methylase RlmL